MAELDALLCCLTPEDCQVAPPESRGDCGPCIWASGIVSFAPEFEELANGKYKSANINYRRPLPLNYPGGPVTCIDPVTGENQNGVAPDPCDCTTVCNGSYAVPKQLATNCWEVSDLDNYCDVNKMDRMEYIMDHMMSEYWIRALYENQILGMLKGIAADNAANDAGDMIVDIVNEPSMTLDGSGTTTMMNSHGHTRAMKSMGCAANSIDGIIMHECVWFNLLMLEAHCCNQSDVFPSEQIGSSPMLRNDNRNGVTQHFYQGRPVYICDHDCLVDLSGPTPIYKTYYFGRGLFGFAEGDLTRHNVMPIETDRDPCVNNAMGATKLYARKSWVLHPPGFTNTWNTGCGDGSQAVDYTLMSELDLANPMFWSRATARKNIPLTIVCSNG